MLCYSLISNRGRLFHFSLCRETKPENGLNSRAADHPPSQVPSGKDSFLLLRTIVSKVTLVSSIVGLSVVSVGATLARVRGRLGGQLSACGVAAGTGRLRTERFAPPTGFLLLLLLLLESPKNVSVSLDLNKSHHSTAAASIDNDLPLPHAISSSGPFCRACEAFWLQTQ